MGRLWRNSAGITEKRFLIPYSAIMFLVGFLSLIMLILVGSILAIVSNSQFGLVASLSFGVIGIVRCAFFISRLTNVPGGPKTPRAVLEWTVFAVAYLCLLATGFLLFLS